MRRIYLGFSQNIIVLDFRSKNSAQQVHLLQHISSPDQKRMKSLIGKFSSQNKFSINIFWKRPKYFIDQLVNKRAWAFSTRFGKLNFRRCREEIKCWYAFLSLPSTVCNLDNNTTTINFLYHQKADYILHKVNKISPKKYV